MYRELLDQCIRDAGVQWAHFEPPCPEEEIAQAEKAVGYSFPEELKALLRETNGDRWLLLSVPQIVECVQLNRKYFTECFDTPEEYEDRIGRLIMFAGNGCGDHYCYRVLPTSQVDNSQIYIWEHETFEHHPVAKDLPDLIRKYYSGQV